jgi:hypothetical protein
LILDVFGIIKRGSRVKIGSLRLRLDLEEYMVYGIELCVDFKGVELSEVLDCECTSGCDRGGMRMLEDLSGWMCIGESGAFNDWMMEWESED